MQVYDVTVGFKRSRQPRDYENATAEVGYKVGVDDGEDYRAVTAAALAQAQVAVYKALGMPDAVKRVSDEMDAGGMVQPGPETEDARPAGGVRPPTQKTIDRAEELGVDWTEVEGTGKDGRVTMADVERHAKQAPGEPTQAEEEPETTPVEQASSLPEPAPSEEVSDRELQRLAGEVARKLGKAQPVVDRMQELGVSRIAEMPADKKPMFLAWLKDQLA